MDLSASNGMRITIDLLGYQFPGLSNEPYDSNWLRVQVHAVHPRGAWTSVDPSLLTYEVAALADWLERVAERRHDAPQTISFTEPNLRLDLATTSMGEDVLRVFFELESRPPWFPDVAVPGEPVWVEFPLCELDLPTAARSLREQLAHFPQRAGE